MKNTKSYLIALPLISLFLFFSCQSIDSVDGLLRVAMSGVQAGKAIVKAAEPITAEQEYFIGRSVAANIIQNYDLYEKKQLDLYLNSICQAIVSILNVLNCTMAIM